MSTATIELKDVGPVKHLRFDVPENGGIVVLKARNGRGKTKTLEAVETAMKKSGNLDVRDGALGGRVDAFGVTLTVGRNTRRRGELEVMSLEGRLSVAELVDPGMKDDGAADTRRIKALVTLARVLPSAELFYGLAGGKDSFLKVVSTNAMASDDLVTMASRIKADFEKAARGEESQAEHEEGRARGAREAAAGVDTTVEHNPTVLQANLEIAVREESRLKSEAESHKTAAEAAERAQAQLDDAEASYSGPSFEEAVAAERRAASEMDDATRAVKDAEEALARAKAALVTAKTKHTTAFEAHRIAEQHQQMVSKWRQQIAASIPPEPSADTLAAASAQVKATRQALEQGAIVRRAKEQIAESDRHAAMAKGHRESAAQLREAAKGTDQVLSEVVAKTGSPLRVEAGRLVLDTGRGATFFADLSMGERWRIALDIAIDAVGSKGVLTIPQEAWEACDPFNRQAIAEHVAGRGVVVLTAEASGDEEIVADIYAADESSS
jgi:hypothetical protein